MFSQENAIRSIFIQEFKNKLPSKILKSPYELKIYPVLSDIEKAVFDSYYTLSDDFYVLSETTPVADKNLIIDVLFRRYSGWFSELPDIDSVNNDFNISILQDTHKDNLENPYIEQKLTLFVFGSLDSYLEMLYIAKIIKSIRITKVLSIEKRQVKGYQFDKLYSSGAMSMIPNSYLADLFGKDYYVRQLQFELVFCEI